ncbi:hypothetical protein BDZ97DRAFT_1765741 [Flammula alnicola]|nr:hypothetical protein BDZ97DRAFT_1765741 [Flammula alnicola]
MPAVLPECVEVQVQSLPDPLYTTTIEKEQTSHFKPANGLARYDHPYLPPVPRLLPIPMIGSTPTHADPKNAQSDIGPSLAVADGHQSVSLFHRASGLTFNGGEYYAVGGNLTIQRTGKSIVSKCCESSEAVRRASNDKKMNEMMGIIMQTSSRSQLPRTISVGFVNLMDATGREHPLTMNMARSFEQFNKALKVLFEPLTPHDRVLCKYMDIGAYDLSIDDGKERLQLMNQDTWSSAVQPGTTIVMSVVMVQLAHGKKYQCPFCDFWNTLQNNFGRSSIDCRSCKRCFHVTRPEQNSFRRDGNYDVESAAVSEEERELIRNLNLTQEWVHFPTTFNSQEVCIAVF